MNDHANRPHPSSSSNGHFFSFIKISRAFNQLSEIARGEDPAMRVIAFFIILVGIGGKDSRHSCSSCGIVVKGVMGWVVGS